MVISIFNLKQLISKVNRNYMEKEEDILTSEQ